MSKPKLAPCPFCGGPGKTYEDSHKFVDVSMPVKVWRVRCGAREDCALLMSYFRTEEDAVAAWNMRDGDKTINLF
ncbi:MAG: Lar family restriction alleviation protein [Oscillospiraceae bacterium]|nr:Lar family restriction alleviation protein [Oscillospiraceae bacterium]